MGRCEAAGVPIGLSLAGAVRRSRQLAGGGAVARNSATRKWPVMMTCFELSEGMLQCFVPSEKVEEQRITLSFHATDYA